MFLRAYLVGTRKPGTRAITLASDRLTGTAPSPVTGSLVARSRSITMSACGSALPTKMRRYAGRPCAGEVRPRVRRCGSRRESSTAANRHPGGQAEGGRPQDRCDTSVTGGCLAAGRARVTAAGVAQEDQSRVHRHREAGVQWHPVVPPSARADRRVTCYCFYVWRTDNGPGLSGSAPTSPTYRGKGRANGRRVGHNAKPPRPASTASTSRPTATVSARPRSTRSRGGGRPGCRS